MSLTTDVPAPAVPLSIRYREYFNTERTDGWPESIRPTALAVVNWGEETIVAFEREIEHLQTQEGAVLGLLKKIGVVALGVIATCCNPVAALAGAAVGVAFGDKLISIQQHLDNSIFLKIAAIVAGIIVSCVASHVLCATFSAVAMAMATQSAFSPLANVVDTVETQIRNAIQAYSRNT